MVKAAPAVPFSARLHVDLLADLGVPRDKLGELKEALARDDLALDHFAGVDYGKLRRTAETIGVPLPHTLARAIAPSTEPPTRLTADPALYPSPKIEVSAPVAHEARAAAPLDRAALDALGPGRGAGARVQRILDAMAARGVDGAAVKLSEQSIAPDALLELLDTKGGAVRDTILASDLRLARETALSAWGPAHRSQDAAIDLSSNFVPLDRGTGAAEGVRVQQKASWRHLSLSRGSDGKSWSLHGFRTESLVVELPPGAKLVVIDAAGHQRQHGLRPQKMSVGDGTASAVELDASMIKPFADDKRSRLDFTLKVIDAGGEVLFEKPYAFNPETGRTSKKILEGGLGTARLPEDGGVDDRRFAAYVPDAAQNPVGLGRRPQLTLAGRDETVERLRFRRDGDKIADVDDLMSFLRPPGGKQTIKVPGKGAVTLSRNSASENALDHPEHDPTRGLSLYASTGSARISFNPELTESRYARWDQRGLAMYTNALSATPQAVVDPLSK